MGTLQDATAAIPAASRRFWRKARTTRTALRRSRRAASSRRRAGVADVGRGEQKLREERIALAQKINPLQTNYTPPAELDPVIYFEDGTTIDTANNIMTMSNGKQIDTTTGLEYHEPRSLISMANGAYLDTKNNILTMTDGTKIDTVTGLKITV